MHRTDLRFFLVIAIVAMAAAASAADIRVTVSGLESAEGEVGCALHGDTGSFPMEPVGLANVWVKPTDTSAECVFVGVPPGAYAVAVSHDLNGNRETDTNFLGLPTEDWGVSNNVRPALRAPRFDEAVFELRDTPVALSIEVDR